MSRPSPSVRPGLNRRRFLQSAALAGAATFAAPAILRAKSPGEKLNIAVVGCGGRGAGNLQSVSGENIVALCDVNQANLDRAAKLHPQARLFRDFRRMYDELTDAEFDAVVVSTTEHTHAFATLPALQRKKHVYCEKPLAHNVVETRIITEAAKAAGVATQMGTQIHAGENYRRVVELIQSGAIGPVREAHVWVGRAWGRQSPEEAKQHHDIVTVLERPAEEQPVPAELDWDLWLGPAVPRPFHSVYFPGPKWYRWWDFGSGTMSDLGSHWNDLPFWALRLDAPRTVEAEGPPPHPELAPASMQATYEYGPRGDMPAVRLTWYQGVRKPELWTQGKIPQWESGALFIGEWGMLLADYSRHQLLVADAGLEKFSPFKLPARSIPPSIGHHAEWIHACKTGAPTTCPFSYSGPLTEANHLGNVAYRAGTRIEWDAPRMKIPNAPVAEQFLTREYRPGWQLA